MPRATVVPVSLAEASTTGRENVMNVEHFHELGALIASHSAHTCATFLPLPPLPSKPIKFEAELYVECLDALTRHLPPTVLLAKGEPMDVLSFEI